MEKVLRKDKHLKQNIGKKVQIKLFQKDEKGKKEQQGILKDFNSEEIIIESQENRIKIERKNIAQMKTVYDW